MSSAHALYSGDGKQILFHLLGDYSGVKCGEKKGGRVRELPLYALLVAHQNSLMC